MSYPFPAYNFPADHDTGFYQSGQVSVGTTPTLICASTGNQSGVVINNGAGAIVYLGGPNVTITTGFPIAVSSTATIPTNGGVINKLYGVTSSGTSTVSYLSPPA